MRKGCVQGWVCDEGLALASYKELMEGLRCGMEVREG